MRRRSSSLLASRSLGPGRRGRWSLAGVLAAVLTLPAQASADTPRGPQPVEVGLDLAGGDGVDLRWDLLAVDRGHDGEGVAEAG